MNKKLLVTDIALFLAAICLFGICSVIKRDDVSGKTKIE